MRKLICGALPRLAPGLTVRKKYMPAESVAARSQPKKAGLSKRPCASACQISSTTLSSARPSACTTRPVISIGSPWAPAASRQLRGGVAAAHHKVVFVDQGVAGRRHEARDAAAARLRVAHGVQNRIALVERLTGEEHLGHEAREP